MRTGWGGLIWVCSDPWTSLRGLNQQGQGQAGPAVLGGLWIWGPEGVAVLWEKQSSGPLSGTRAPVPAVPRRQQDVAGKIKQEAELCAADRVWPCPGLTARVGTWPCLSLAWKLPLARLPEVSWWRRTCRQAVGSLGHLDTWPPCARSQTPALSWLQLGPGSGLGLLRSHNWRSPTAVHPDKAGLCPGDRRYGAELPTWAAMVQGPGPFPDSILFLEPVGASALSLER